MLISIKKSLIIFITLALFVLLIYSSLLPVNTEDAKSSSLPAPQFNVWLVFTKVKTDSPLKYKFHNLIWNLLNITSVPLKFHVIVDTLSEEVAQKEFRNYINVTKKNVNYFFYDVQNAAASMQDIVSILTPHFSSKPGTYYSDALFYMSLGLYRIAPIDQKMAVMLDCDLLFKKDIKLLFNQFEMFKKSTLFGLAPELTPVYRHILHSYRTKNQNSTFGDYYHNDVISNTVHPRGFQGYNSGVVLLHLDNIRKSKIYREILSNGTVNILTNKYNFKGHLGDQDFYTLVGFEYPTLIQTLNCRFNRQLCTWWRDHGYSDVFQNYFKCDHEIVVLHGNCNTKIPTK